MENRIWLSQSFSYGQAWIDLIMLANHQDGFFYVRGNRVDVNRGQVGCSMKKLAARWKWSRGKVWRFLETLKNERQIEHQKTTVTTLITILNYDEHQKTDSQTDIRRTSDGHKQECKEGKEEEIYPFSEFWSLYNKKEGKKDCLKIWSKLNEEDHKQIMERLPIWLSNHANGQFRPYPKTFLNGRRWEDESKTEQRFIQQL